MHIHNKHNHSKCIESGIKQAEEICLKLNVKFTKLRKKVLELIWESHKPIKAYEILERLKQDEKIGQPITVYRILDFFLEIKMIHKIESQNAFLACSHPGAAHNCYFLICKKCNNITEACKDDLTSKLQSIASNNSFIIHDFTIEIQGICSNCN